MMSCVAAEKQTKTALTEGMPNTIKLPNGEIVYDISGEWKGDFHHKNYVSEYHNVIINQNGKKIVFIVLESGEYFDEGNEVIEGELGKQGFSNLKADTSHGWNNSTGKIENNGNSIKINNAWIDIELTKK